MFPYFGIKKVLNLHETVLLHCYTHPLSNLKITAWSGVFTPKHDMLMQVSSVLKTIPGKFLLHNRKNTM